MKGYVTNWSEEIFVINKVKNSLPWTYVISDFNGKNISGTIYEKEFQMKNKKEFRVEKVIKKVINYMLNGKATIIILAVEVIKQT